MLIFLDVSIIQNGDFCVEDLYSPSSNCSWDSSKFMITIQEPFRVSTLVVKTRKGQTSIRSGVQLLHLVSEFDDDTDATQRRWKCLNVPAHIIRAHGWGNIPLEDELAVRICSLLQEFSASDPEVYEDHEDLIAACKGALAFMNGDLETATDIIDSVLMTESASEEIVMTAHLIRARIYVQSGDDESAVEHYGAIIDRASAQFSQLVAIAKREMAALSNG